MNAFRYKIYLNNATREEKILDYSVLFSDEYDRNIAHQLLVDWYNGFDLTRGSIYENRPYRNVFNKIMQLGNSKDLSTGALWGIRKMAGNNILDYLQNYMEDNYLYGDLDNYFVDSELSKSNYVLKPDLNLGATELDYIVSNYIELKHDVRDIIYNDLLNSIKAHEMENSQYNLTKRYNTI
jgi:hypothetical protein